MLGYRGNNLTSVPGADPQTALGDDSGTELQVIANQTNPNTQATGGVAEFHLANPVVALQGSGTADAPLLQIRLNTTGCPFPANTVTMSYNLRDVDGSADNAIQPVALQSRNNDIGNYTNIPAGFVADATSGPSIAALVTPVSVTLPSALQGNPVVHVRIISADAVGNDEWVGIDDINVNCVAAADTTAPTVTAMDDGDADNVVTIGSTLTYTVTFNEDIDAASVTAADFDNAGTAGIVIGTITETSAGVFTVQITANSAGSLNLRIPTGSIIEDVAGNDLVVPVLDDDTLSVVPAPTNPTGAGAANPPSGIAGFTTVTFTVTVTPGANPASTGIGVVGDLSAIGGSATQTFLDNGAFPDAAAGDNVFTAQQIIQTGTVPGSKSIPFTVSDAEARSSNGSIAFTVDTPTPDISQDATELDLGDQPVGVASGVRSVRFANVGTGDLTITAITSDNPEFVVQNPPPPSRVVGPFNTATFIGVVFTPSAGGTRTGTITVSSDDPDEPTLTLNVTGNGTLTFTVNNTDDTNDGVCDADCSMREAVTAANANAGADAIVFDQAAFPPGGPAQEIILGGSEIVIDGDLTINGPGANLLTIGYPVTPGVASRIFSIDDATVTISGMTLRRGNAQGSVQSGDGGAILARDGALTLDRVHLNLNTAPSGGAVYLQLGTHQLLNSTCSSNSGGNAGGCIFAVGATLTVSSSTIHANSADDGGGINGGNSDVTITGSTITGNDVSGSGGGLFVSSGTVTVGNSIVAGNTATTSGPEIGRLPGGTFTSNGYNLVGDTAGDAENTINPVAYAATDILNTPPLLDPLANNGGPTPTQMPQIGSPVIDRGDSFGLSLDQRGALRTADFATIPNAMDGDGTDIGAFEVQIPTAAPASIRGRVTAADGFGLRSTIVTVQGGDLPVPRAVTTGTFGYYRIEGLTAGQTYIVSVRSRRYIFANGTRVVNLSDNLDGLNFTARR